MAGLSELVGGDEPIKIGGKQYILSQLRITEQHKIESRILSLRGDPIAIARRLAEDATPEERKELFAQAYDDSMKAQQVTAGELDDFKTSVTGAVFCFWLSLRKHHPEITEEQAGELMEEQAGEALAEAIEKLQEQFPDATPEQIAETMISVEDGAVAELVAKISGMPVGNPSTPAKPGTESESSRGSNGLSTPAENGDSPTTK